MRRRAVRIAAALAALLVVGVFATVWSVTNDLITRFSTGSQRTPDDDGWGGKVSPDGPTPGVISFGSARPSEDPPGVRLTRMLPWVRNTHLEAGDVILSIDGTLYTDAGEMVSGLLRDHLAGDQVSVRIWKQKTGVEEEQLLTLDPFVRHPGDMELEYEDVTIESESGFTLRGWFIPAPEGSDGRCGVIVQGSQGSRFQGLRSAKHWNRRGYGLLLMDLSGSGASGGDFVTYSVNERHDVVAMTRWLRERGAPGRKIGVYGSSAGTASAIYAASMDEGIAAVAVLAAFSDMWASMGERLEDMGLPSSLAWPLAWAVERRGGFDVRDIRPIDAIADVRVPVLFIHGDADKLVLPYHSERMHEARLAAGLPSERWLLRGVGHDLPRTRPVSEYWDRVLDFLDAAIGEPPSGESAEAAPS